MAGAELKPAHLLPALIVLGAGQGYIMTPLLNLVLGVVDEADSGMAAGVVSTVQQVGAALGVAVVGILFTSVLTEATSLSQRGQYASAFVAGMFYNLAAAVLVCWLLWMMQKSPRLSR